MDNQRAKKLSNETKNNAVFVRRGKIAIQIVSMCEKQLRAIYVSETTEQVPVCKKTLFLAPEATSTGKWEIIGTRDRTQLWYIFFNVRNKLYTSFLDSYFTRI